MMKITVDTNVLISATFWRGASYKVVNLAEQKKLRIILSKEIIEEYRNVLGYKEIQEKIQNKNLEMRWSVVKIGSLAKIIVPEMKLKVIEADPDDNKILECALAGNVEYIISQDKHLLGLGTFGGIKILAPDVFLRTVKF